MMLLNSWTGPAVVLGFSCFVFVLGSRVTPWCTDHMSRREKADSAIQHRAGAE
jgi:hypothetical protein